MRNKFLVFVFLPTVAVCIIAFWTRGILLLDPDFGWHLRMGELILQEGIPKTDPFSYTMPSYPFVSHEWLTDILLSNLYPLIGTGGLSVIFAILATLAILIQLPFPIKKWFFVPFVLAAGSFLGFVGIRPQVISWVFLSILLYILFKVCFKSSLSVIASKAKQSKDGIAAGSSSPRNDRRINSGLARMTALRWYFVLPFLFFVWANLHGGFGMGIFVLLIATAIRMWEKRRIVLGELALLFFCIAATLINPYGIHLWRELWTSISDSSLRWSISEWMPALFTFNFTLWSFVSLSVLTVIRYRKKFNLSQLALYFVLLIGGLSSIRHVPFWLILALPMTTSGISWFAEEVKLCKGGVKRLNKVYFFFAIGVMFIVFVEGALNLWGVKALSEETFYPKKAVEYLRTNKSCGQIFSTYGWGGYLIWKLPEEKVFIDGRMPSWRWVAKPPESSYAFEEYSKVLAGKIPVKSIVGKYNIDTFLLPVERKEDVLPFLKDLQEKLEKLFNRPSDDYGGFIKQLKDKELAEVYRDENAVIYREKDHQTKCDKT